MTVVQAPPITGYLSQQFCEHRNLDVINEATHQSLNYALSDEYKMFTQ